MPAVNTVDAVDGDDEDGFPDDFDFDEDDAEAFTPMKARVKKVSPLVRTDLAEPSGDENAFATTYKPSRHEAGWLLDSLGPFREQNLIADVLYLVKGGKEANVYCCVAGSAAPAGVELLAAKVYRPRAFRNLRNDRMYREGRAVLTSEGRAVKATDTRILRALGKKTDFGVQVQHTSWLMYEYTTLQKLYEHGAAVPLPVASAENAVLMGFLGDRHGAAPTLSEMGVDAALGRKLFAQICVTIEELLKLGLIHGDLSAYNVLCYAGNAAVIDFPQVLQIETNPHAAEVLQRDLDRICEYFTRAGVENADAEALFARLWGRYGVEAG